MKIRHLPYVFSIILAFIGFSISYAETVELGIPLPGRILVRIQSDVISKRLQISGSLNPLRIFINGQERTSELVNGNCPEAGLVNFNNNPIETQGGPGVFYWEGIQVQEKLSLSLKNKENCLVMESKIPLAFFERPYFEEVYLPEKNVPHSWDIKLEGEGVNGVSVTMDQGNLKINEKWEFTHELKPGTNIVTGLLKDQSGKITPLLLKFHFTVESPKENEPGLLLNFLETSSPEVMQVSGKVNIGTKLLINGEETEVSEEQEFFIKRPLEFGENIFNFESVNSSGLKTKFTKIITRPKVIDKPWPILPLKSYIGVNPFHVHALKSIESDLRVTDSSFTYLVYGTHLGPNNDSWEFFFRYVGETFIYPEQVNQTIVLKKHYGLGALRLFPWKKAVHFGFGLSYEQLKRHEGSEANLLHDLHLIGKVGWMKTFGNHWAAMSSFSPFIAIPLGKKWEKFGFDLSLLTVVYSF